MECKLIESRWLLRAFRVVVSGSEHRLVYIGRESGSEHVYVDDKPVAGGRSVWSSTIEQCMRNEAGRLTPARERPINLSEYQGILVALKLPEMVAWYLLVSAMLTPSSVELSAKNPEITCPVSKAVNVTEPWMKPVGLRESTSVL